MCQLRTIECAHKTHKSIDPKRTRLTCGQSNLHKENALSLLWTGLIYFSSNFPKHLSAYFGFEISLEPVLNAFRSAHTCWNGICSIDLKLFDVFDPRWCCFPSSSSFIGMFRVKWNGEIPLIACLKNKLALGSTARALAVFYSQCMFMVLLLLWKIFVSWTFVFYCIV